ncbi:hypothetical protein BDZ89DRAFT_1038900 [Hymenopellis radicata]|nr:hypothetical protein BDZ89DRAFT_1038900 [Hymenopellis radicata]
MLFDAGGMGVRSGGTSSCSDTVVSETASRSSLGTPFQVLMTTKMWYGFWVTDGRSGFHTSVLLVRSQPGLDVFGKQMSTFVGTKIVEVKVLTGWKARWALEEERKGGQERACTEISRRWSATTSELDLEGWSEAFREYRGAYLWNGLDLILGIWAEPANGASVDATCHGCGAPVIAEVARVEKGDVGLSLRGGDSVSCALSFRSGDDDEGEQHICALSKPDSDDDDDVPEQSMMVGDEVDLAITCGRVAVLRERFLAINIDLERHQSSPGRVMLR